MRKYEYEVEFYPLTVIVEAYSKNDAEEEAIAEIISGELEYEVKEVRKSIIK